MPYSISEGLVGFRFDLGQGYQYGYADIAGSTLYGVRFETTPDVAVPFGAVPEPADLDDADRRLRSGRAGRTPARPVAA